MKTKKPIIPLPYPIYFWTVFIIGCFGLLDSIYLTISHYRIYTDICYVSFCSLSKAINCDTVSQSPYSILLHIPVPVWGVIGYLFFLTILSFARKKSADGKKIWTLMLWITICFCLFSIYFAIIALFYIKSFCLMCFISYGVNSALVYFIWLIRNRFQIKGFFSEGAKDFNYLLTQKKTPFLLIAILFATLIILYGILFPPYWKIQKPLIAENISMSKANTYPPWIGAKNPELVIEEYVDYQCFACRKNHFLLRALISKYPNKIRLIHHNFPMDQEYNPLVREPFHIGSAKLALIADYATLTKNFWHVNDILFEIGYQPDVLTQTTMAKRLEMKPEEIEAALFDKRIKTMLRAEIRQGALKKIVGTPTYIIDNKIYKGHIPYDVFKKVIKGSLKSP